MIIEEFRRNRKEGSKNNKFKIVREKMIKIVCDKCQTNHTRLASHYKKMKATYPELFIKDYCNTCWRPILNNRPEYKQSLSNGVKSFHKTEESVEYRNNMSKFHKGRIAGDNNPMKNIETQKKVSATRSLMMKDLKEREKYVQGSIDAHARGAYLGVDTTGRCKWHDYTHSNGSVYKVQGTWELKFIKWLDDNNIEFNCHEGRLPYTSGRYTRNYYPDFYVPSMGGYVDIKSNYWYMKQKDKWELLEKQYPNKIKIFKKQELNKLGINV